MSEQWTAPDAVTDEVARLIATLHETEGRLEELTLGEVDTVVDRQGRPFVFRRAQEQIRRTEASRQAAILNALPAHIALVDGDGFVVSVNTAWRRFGLANSLQMPGAAVGANYLDVCDRARGQDAEQAHAAADGIRAVLAGRIKIYEDDYSCDSPEEERWFRLIVTPLSDDLREGAVIVHADITERRVAETALETLSLRTQQRERTLNTVLSSISDFAYIFDRKGKFLFANQPLLDLWGLQLEEVIGKDFSELGYAPALAAGLLAQVQEVFETRKIVRDETEYRSPTGAEGFFEYIFLPVIADDASVHYVVGSTRDITERKRAAEALAEGEREQRKLAGQLDVERTRLLAAQRVAKMGSWETDLSTMSVSWSDETRRIFETGTTVGDTSHEEFLRIVHPDDRVAVDEAFRLSLLDPEARSIWGRGFIFEHRLLFPEGRIKFVEERWSVVFDLHDRPIRVSGTCQDITERRQSETALRESQKRLRDVFDGLGPSMFVALLTPEGVLVEINRSPLEAAGLNAGDVLGRPFAETHWWSYSPAVQQQLREAIVRAGRGEASRYDVRTRGEGEAMIDIDFSLQPLRDDTGAVVFLIPSASVITERKQAEEALRKSQKLEAVGQLAAGVAHEFNNILQTLMSMTTIARMRGINPEVVKIAADMEIQIQRGAGVTQQLLLAARHQEPTKTTLDLCEQVATMRDLLRRLIPENIVLVVDLPQSPVGIEGDAGQIQQVLLNLAINARDAMPDGGTLTLRVISRGREVALEVEDDGSGFDEKTRDHLFEPFFTTKEVGKGTGLGLAVVNGIVEQHGGSIEVRSQPGVGSLFRVILPQRPWVEVSAEPGKGSQLQKATGRILLVEDEQGVREGLGMLLKMIGYEVTSVGKAEEALALPLTPAPDVLLSDVSLPGIGGAALADILCARWPSLRVTLMTGYIDEATRVTAREQGWYVLQKPFEIDELGTHLLEAFNSSPSPELPITL